MAVFPTSPTILLTLFFCCFRPALAEDPDTPPSPPCTKVHSVEQVFLNMQYTEGSVSIPISADENLTLFHQPSLDLDPHLPSAAASFTSTFSYDAQSTSANMVPPILTFILIVRSSTSLSSKAAGTSHIYYWELQVFTGSNGDQQSLSSTLNPRPICGAQLLHVQEFDENGSFNSTEAEIRQTSFGDDVSLRFDKNAGKLFVKAAHHQQGHDFNFTCDLCITGCATDPQQSESSLTLLVGYITGRNATISVRSNTLQSTTSSMTPSSSFTQKSHDHSNLVWILVGSFSMLCLAALTMLVLIKWYKNHRSTPTRSHPTLQGGQSHTAERLRCDLESSKMPMMHSPPFSFHHDNAFQVSRTASWMKEPTPR